MDSLPLVVSKAVPTGQNRERSHLLKSYQNAILSPIICDEKLFTMIQDFGIIIACCFKDYHFAAGCCASIRYFGGDVPICLIVDGDFNTTSLEKTYGVKIINQKTVKHPFLKENSFGWGLTKMIAFWESPWQNFLFLDADTIIWGMC
ncbi:hypothetical protein ACOKW7_03225 [Limnospira platensis CENA597]|uniref:hypothetical protein n=1 Tax=Limnospira platensis TaxID=118562 RepID=UPI003D9FB520